MSSLKQINISYNKIEDRLLVQITNLEEQELRLWLTHHLTAKMLEALNERLERQRPPGVDAETAKKILQVDKAMASSGNAEQNQPLRLWGKHLPLGENGALVTGLSVKPRGDSFAVTFATREGGNIDMNLPRDLLLTVIHAVEQKSAEAGWVFEKSYHSLSVPSFSHATH